ncbi:MAG TPA: TetR/AcrR family transcriptional regulator [Candidatus Fournierella merdipullorum]|uniref:TetR/AcrR family transcriptional regulator n=1 Tax=Candidatus Allofournierella merdipullorum TaxID=2838595 RepID=A0A9D2E4R7_9FIRM|nr:TetR/AcrR family transcriptional regulator [Candidatus Fournierella merdipullorum]
MNEAFFALEEEKQRAVFNAAMEVFSRWEYKRASTDLIAAKAGVSKGLLFYYFHNKKTLYLETFAYAQRLVSAFIQETVPIRSADFFDRLGGASREKMRLMAQSPFLLDFCVRAYYSEGEDVSTELRRKIGGELGGLYATWFEGVDTGRFRPGVDPAHLLNMIAWMTDGYIHTRRMEGKPLDLEERMAEVDGWMKLFRAYAYKEEE